MVLFRHLLAVVVCQTSLFLVTLTVLRNTSTLFSVFLLGIIRCFSHGGTEVIVFLGRGRKTLEVKYHSLTSCHGTYKSRWLTIGNVNPDHLAKVFINYEAILFHPFSTIFFGRKSICEAQEGVLQAESCYGSSPWEWSICMN